MVKREFYETRKDGVNLYRTYSDQDLQIQKVGTNEIYDEAIDVETATYEYVETDMPIEPIEGETDEATTEDYIEALAELGVEE